MARMAPGQQQDAYGQEKEVPDLVSRPRDFHHPYTPYDIQETFMSTVYQVLQDGKVGILESPTGTVSTRTDTSYNLYFSSLL